VEVFMPYRKVAANGKHWRCGGFLCYLCLVPLLIKDKMLIVYFAGELYSSAETEAD